MAHARDLIAELNCTVPVTWTNDIQKLFGRTDVDHMKAATAGRLDLSSYDSVKIWAWKVYEYVENKYMPPSAPWPDAQILTFGCWVKAGCPR
jgi:hypothetical protein